LAVAGIGALAYAAYFDHKRRTDAGFRKRLRKEKKKLDKSVAQEATSTEAPGSALDDVTVPTAEILAAMKSVQDDQVPTTPEEREKYFIRDSALPRLGVLLDRRVSINFAPWIMAREM
jgi:import receptor subunit TOM20